MTQLTTTEELKRIIDAIGGIVEIKGGMEAHVYTVEDAVEDIESLVQDYTNAPH